MYKVGDQISLVDNELPFQVRGVLDNGYKVRALVPGPSIEFDITPDQINPEYMDNCEIRQSFMNAVHILRDIKAAVSDRDMRTIRDLVREAEGLGILDALDRL